MDSKKDAQLRRPSEMRTGNHRPLGGMERKMTLQFGYDPASGKSAVMHTDEHTGLVSVVAENQGKPGVHRPAIGKGVVIDHED